MEKFKSHRELNNRCRELINNKQIVCQTIKDYATMDFEFLSSFNLEHDYIYQITDETEFDYGLWKIGRGRKYENMLS